MTTESNIPIRQLGRLGRLVLGIAVFTGLLAPLTTAQPALAGVSFDQKMLELVNQQRAAAGIAPVQPSLILNTIAGPGPYLGCGLPLAGRATDMGIRDYFSHTILNCGNQSVFNILTSTGGLVYSAAAENIAWMNGTSDPLVAAERLVNDLMNSPGHRANILDRRFTHVGIGSWNSAAGQTWSGGGIPLTRVWITAQVFAQMPLAAAPTVSLSPTSVGFGDQAVGSTATAKTVTVKNTGSASLSVTGVSVSGTNASDFRVASNSCGSGVAAGASCTVGVGFSPTAPGARSASLTITDNAADSPRVVTLSGNGTVAPPAAPLSVSATGGDGEIRVSWQAAPSGPAVVGYGVFVYDASGYTGKSSWVCAACTSATVGGVANGKQYYVVVYGYDGTAWGTPAASASVWALAVPVAVTVTRAAPGDGQLTLWWTGSSGAEQSVDGYGVFVFDAKGYTGRSTWVCGTCTSATVLGLTNGIRYSTFVYAHNAHGWGAGANTSLVVGTPDVPGRVLATKGNGSVNVSWTPATPGGSPIARYGAFAYDANGYTGHHTEVCGTCTSAVISGLTGGKQYAVLVYAYNDFGWGVPATSNPVAL